MNRMDREQQHQEDLQRIRGFRLIDDDFLNACFDDNIECTELILRIILGKPDIVVKRVKTQKVMKNLLGRDIWLDIDATDSKDNELNIEVQRADKGAGRKRARYHSSILDAHLLKSGEDFDALPETYVIFLTEHDVIGGNKPIYRVERHIEETGELFSDGEHIIYVNGEDKNSATELGRLMHDFFCIEPDDMHYKELADRTRYFKKDEKGVATLCKVLEDMRNQSVWEAKVESVHRWLAMNMTYEQIAQGEGLTVEQVKEIASQKSA